MVDFFVSESVTFATIIAVLMLATGCSNTSEDCDCAPPGLYLQIQKQDEEVTEVRVTGDVCEGNVRCESEPAVNGTCTIPENGFQRIYVDPEEGGSCTIELDTPDGTITSEVSFTEYGGCCSGVYVDQGGVDGLRDAGIDAFAQ